jgi:hypothetical protein
MARKKRPGFRFSRSIAEELKAMAEGPPRRPIKCTSSTRRPKKSQGDGAMAPGEPPTEGTSG